MPSWAASRNVYLTAANGAAGSEVLYATGVTATTYACSAANVGSTAPPANNRAPNYRWACGSIAASNSNSIANTSVNPGNPYASNPWTYDSWADFLRHHAKYNTGSNGLNGPTGVLAQQVAYLKNNYVPVPGQPPAVVMAYEADYFTLVSQPVQNNPPSNAPILLGQLLHDISYHPTMYYVELAYLQSLQTGGLALANMQTIAGHELPTAPCRPTPCGLARSRAGAIIRTARERTCSGLVRVKLRISTTSRGSCRHGRTGRRRGTRRRRARRTSWFPGMSPSRKTF